MLYHYVLMTSMLYTTSYLILISFTMILTSSSSLTTSLKRYRVYMLRLSMLHDYRMKTKFNKHLSLLIFILHVIVLLHELFFFLYIYYIKNLFLCQPPKAIINECKGILFHFSLFFCLLLEISFFVDLIPGFIWLAIEAICVIIGVLSQCIGECGSQVLSLFRSLRPIFDNRIELHAKPSRARYLSCGHN